MSLQDVNLPPPHARRLRDLPWRLLRWIRRHKCLTAFLFLLFAFLLVNVLAYRHARSMTHFVADGVRPANPEALSRFEKLKVLLTGISIPRPRNQATPESVGLAFSTHTFASTDGTRLEAWYAPRPQSRGVVLLFHGYASCKASLLREAKAFHELGYAAFLVDFRGSGGSEGNETTVGVKEADDVAAAVAYVQKLAPTKPMILYGQSMGSAAVLRAVAVCDVRPEAIVIENPFDRLLSTVANRFKAMGAPSFPAAHLLVFWGGVQCGFDGFYHNPADYAKDVSCPVLVLHGEDDPRVVRAEVDAVFDNLNGAKELVLLPGVGHESCLSANPRRWREAVPRFLDKHVRSDVT